MDIQSRSLNQFVNKAEQLAKQVINPEQYISSFSKGANSYYRAPYSYYQPFTYLPFTGFGSSTHNHYHHHNSQSSKRAKEDSLNGIMAAGAIFSAIASAFVVYSVGSDWGTLSNVKRDIKKLDSDYSTAINMININSKTSRKIERMFEEEREILTTMKREARTRLWTKGTTLTGLALTAANLTSILVTESALFPSAGLIAATTLGLGTMAWAFNAGFSSTNDDLRQQGLELLQTIQDLRSAV